MSTIPVPALRDPIASELTREESRLLTIARQLYEKSDDDDDLIADILQDDARDIRNLLYAYLDDDGEGAARFLLKRLSERDRESLTKNAPNFSAWLKPYSDRFTSDPRALYGRIPQIGERRK